MKNLIYLLFIIIFISSCSIFDDGTTTKYNKTVKLYKIDWLEKDIKIFLYKKDNYKLYIPIRYLVNYVNFSSENSLLVFFKYADSLINLKSEQKIFPNTMFNLKGYGKYFDIFAYRDLFESGSYIIYDTKENKYITEVTVDSYVWSGGPLAADVRYKVYIKGKIFWEINVQA